MPCRGQRTENWADCYLALSPLPFFFLLSQLQLDSVILLLFVQQLRSQVSNLCLNLCIPACTGHDCQHRFLTAVAGWRKHNAVMQRFDIYEVDNGEGRMRLCIG